ncbi:hypothetical protein LZK73_21965 [Neorhizobium galegae]|nr:hypothetical protein LZK73_21965 [Neorhizobium galegae]
MENLTRTLADIAIARTYVAPPQKEKRVRPVTTPKDIPEGHVTRQQLRAAARSRAKVQRSAMKAAGRIYDKAARKASA